MEGGEGYVQMEFDMTVSHWRWCVDSLDTGAGIQLGQCKPIMCIISISVPLIVQVKSSISYI